MTLKAITKNDLLAYTPRLSRSPTYKKFGLLISYILKQQILEDVPNTIMNTHYKTLV